LRGITVAISGDGLTRQPLREAKVGATAAQGKTRAPIVRCIAGLCCALPAMELKNSEVVYFQLTSIFSELALL